ncbi:amidohydrolase, partial [bacterium]|nr:amidohydrolase [bacterium]
MIIISDSLFKEIKTARKWLHRHPEISYEEYQTTEFIANTLASWNVEFHRFNSLKTGGWADIGGNDKNILGFRADIDGLPITENAKHSVRSKHDGVMHACGHDYHTAIGLGLIRYFLKNPDNLNGKLRVIFQPAEETTPDGASFVCKESIFKSMSGIFAVHVDPELKIGQFSIINGQSCASSTLVKITFNGPGGHTSRPHKTVDLIRVTAQYIVQLQGYLKSIINSRDDFILVFGSIHGGSYHNVIPSKISLVGTVRNFDNNVLKQLLEEIRKFSQHFETIYDLKISVDFPNSTPAVVNDSKMYDKFINFSKSNGYSKNV